MSNSVRPKDGFRDVTYGEFAKSINKAAWWLDSGLGDAKTIDTFTSFGP